MPVYNKLVRDKIPAVIKQDGKNFEIKTLSDKEFQTALLDKFQEEILELKQAPDQSKKHEELADLLEIIHKLAELNGSSIDQIEEIRKTKREKRGGFDKKIFLIEVED